MGVLSNVEPKEVFKHFEAISLVPRRSDHDEKISAYCVEFAKERNLEYVQDAVGNVVIYKPGTAGYENSEPVILQGHMDMVASKTVESDHDFDNDPLDLFVDGDFVGAKDTTLGGDDGFALAFAMAVLDSDDIPHPPLECVFTVDEENGMSGAENFDASLLHGRKMFNMDGEEEGVLTVGCAGANICDVVIPVEREEVEGVLVTIKNRKFLGGHSGNDIQNQRGNANKIMARILYVMGKKYDIKLKSFNGGSAQNVIAQFATAEVVVPADKAEEFAADVNAFGETILAEFFGQEPNATITAAAGEAGTFCVMTMDSTYRVVTYIYAALEAVQTMDRAIEGAVESSLNAGVVATADNEVSVSYQVRSSVDSKLQEMMDRMEILCNYAGGEIKINASYPAWAYREDSELRPLMVEIYKEMFDEEPELLNSHGGLEGGILTGKKPDLDIVCFGPNLISVHTPAERIQISSTQRIWEYFKKVLAACK